MQSSPHVRHAGWCLVPDEGLQPSHNLDTGTPGYEPSLRLCLSLGPAPHTAPDASLVVPALSDTADCAGCTTGEGRSIRRRVCAISAVSAISAISMGGIDKRRIVSVGWEEVRRKGHPIRHESFVERSKGNTPLARASIAWPGDWGKTQGCEYAPDPFGGDMVRRFLPVPFICKSASGFRDVRCSDTPCCVVTVSFYIPPLNGANGA